MSTGGLSVIVVALIVGLSPLLLSLLTGRQRRRERAEDWARQDQVAKQVEVAAERAANTARLLLADNRKVAAAAREVSQVVTGRLDQIHHLVNSNLSAALQAQADAIGGQIVLARRLALLQPGEGDAEDIRRLEHAHADLVAKLVDRAEQTEAANARMTEAVDAAGRETP